MIEDKMCSEPSQMKFGLFSKRPWAGRFVVLMPGERPRFNKSRPQKIDEASRKNSGVLTRLRNVLRKRLAKDSVQSPVDDGKEVSGLDKAPEPATVGTPCVPEPATVGTPCVPESATVGTYAEALEPRTVVTVKSSVEPQVDCSNSFKMLSRRKFDAGEPEQDWASAFIDVSKDHSETLAIAPCRKQSHHDEQFRNILNVLLLED